MAIKWDQTTNYPLWEGFFNIDHTNKKKQYSQEIFNFVVNSMRLKPYSYSEKPGNKHDKMRADYQFPSITINSKIKKGQSQVPERSINSPSRLSKYLLHVF